MLPRSKRERESMAVLKIVRMGHPVLLARAEEVALPADAELRRLARDMVETMDDANGVGLAAPQVAVPLRMIVFKVARDEPGEAPPETRILLNPVIAPLSEDLVPGWEGCLSIPGLRGAVPRFPRIRYRGTDLDGAPVDVEAEGFHARVVQHEVDHLDGILYPMRMEDFRLFGFNEEILRAAARAEAAEDEDAGTEEKETA